jgi:hypothetical protein
MNCDTGAGMKLWQDIVLARMEKIVANTSRIRPQDSQSEPRGDEGIGVGIIRSISCECNGPLLMEERANLDLCK